MAEKSIAFDIGALIVSILALFVSIVAPYITYRCLQNDVQIQKLKARALRASQGGGASALHMEKGGYTVDYFQTVEIRNEGDLPVGGVEVIIELPGSFQKPFETVHVRAEPARKLNKHADGGSLIVLLDTSIAPGDLVTLYFEQSGSAKRVEDINIPLNGQILIWVRSEASPAIPVTKPSANTGDKSSGNTDQPPAPGL